MCFSASASFALGTLLFAAGVHAILSVINRGDWAYLCLASTPLFFGIQQYLEGVVWLMLGSGATTYLLYASVAYLLFPGFFWLIWMPLSAYLIETRYPRLLLLSLIIGIVAAIAHTIPLLWYPSYYLDPQIVHHSISYFRDVPSHYSRIAYAVLILNSLFLSSNNKVKILGGIILITAVIAYLLYAYAFASVWCLFGAVASMYVLYIVQY